MIAPANRFQSISCLSICRSYWTRFSLSEENPVLFCSSLFSFLSSLSSRCLYFCSSGRIQSHVDIFLLHKDATEARSKTATHHATLVLLREDAHFANTCARTLLTPYCRWLFLPDRFSIALYDSKGPPNVRCSARFHPSPSS
jgi:hypothetical protein